MKHMYFRMDGRWYHSENCWYDKIDRSDLRDTMGQTPETLYRWFDVDPPDCGWFADEQEYEVKVTVRTTDIMTTYETATDAQKAKDRAVDRIMQNTSLGYNKSILATKSRQVKK